MWGNEHPGKIFTCSNIGNRVFQKTEEGEKLSGDVIYPVEHTGTDTVVVVGHTGCGAVTATYQDIENGLEEPAGIRHCIDLLKNRIEEGARKLPDNIDEEEAINRLVEYNVDRQVEILLESQEIEDVDVVGAVYDFQDVYSGDRGELHLININGETSVSDLKKSHEDLAGRIERIWEP